MAKLDAENQRVVRVKKPLTELDAANLEILLNHVRNFNNPHRVNKTQLGISNTGGVGGNDVYNEVPVGSINGSNTVFTTANNFELNTTRVFLNGLRLFIGSSNDYEETSSNQITLNYAPKTGSILIIDYSLVT